MSPNDRLGVGSLERQIEGLTARFTALEAVRQHPERQIGGRLPSEDRMKGAALNSRTTD